MSYISKYKFQKIFLYTISILLAIGIFFRFYNIDKKIYWYDETMTSIRISGHTTEAVIKDVFNGQIINVQDLLKTYQYPNLSKGLNDTIQSLSFHPEHSPLYYLIARFWLQILGNSVTTIRLLSVLISLLAFPCIYWLCQELFNSPKISLVAVAIIAISPFHVLYAQEAREYSLWIVTILLSSAMLLKAIRLNTWLNWSGYSVTVAISLYTHPFSAFVIISHSIYTLIKSKFAWNQTVKRYLFSLISGLILFLPWLLIVFNNFDYFLSNTASVNVTRSGFLPIFWTLNLSRIFIDFNQGISPFSPLHYLSLCLAGYALYYLCRHASLPAWIFIITLIGVIGTALIVPDIILGGRRSSITRYAIPCYLGIQISVAYLMTTKLTNIELSIKVWKRWFYLAIFLVISGILSCIISSQTPVWWHKSYAKSRYLPEVANMINQIKNPLIISDEIPGNIFSLAHLLKTDASFQLVVAPEIPEIPKNFAHILLYKPSETLLQKLKNNYNFEKKQSWLWQLKN